MISFTSITRQNSGWLFTWQPTGANYYRVVLQGEEIGQTIASSYSFSRPEWAGYPPPLEVVEEDELALSEKYSPFRILQWYRSQGAILYPIEEEVDAGWEARSSVHQTVDWVYTFKTPRLRDQVFYTFRVRALDDIQQYSGALIFDDLIVTTPDFDETLHGVGWDKPNLSLVVG